MKRVMLIGALAAAAVATAMACGSDTVASPEKAVSGTSGANGGGTDSSGSSPGDTSAHSNPGGNHRYPWLTITPEAAAVQIHSYLALHATEYDTNGTPVSAKITWRSSDEHIATVGDTGLVHGVGLGVVTIFASADGINDSAVVAVVDTAVATAPPPPDSGTVSPPDSTRPPPPPPPDSVPPA